MQYNVSHFLREPVGCQWDVEVDEEGTAESVLGEWIRGQLKFTRSNQGIWAEAHLNARMVQVCDRCLRIYMQPVNAEFTELYHTSEPNPTDLANGELFVDDHGIVDLEEVLRQYLILNLPSKLLCHSKCVGICSDCGANNDNHDYYCRNQEQELTADPRWRELAALGSSGERGL